MPDHSQLGPLDCTEVDEQFVHKMLGLSPAQVQHFLDDIAHLSGRTGLDYIKDDGTRIIIPITPAPAVFSARQVRELRRAFAALAAAVAKVAAAWLDSPALQRVLPLEPYEADWLRLAKNAPGNPPQRIFHRWDFALNLADDADTAKFKLFEVNSVDVGGVHYAAAAREVMHRATRHVGADEFSIAADQCGEDSRVVLQAALAEHSAQLGKPLARVAIAENQDFTTGITEAESLRKYLSDCGIETQCVDARQVVAENFDVVYRNIELRDLADLETAGGDLSGLRAAAKQGKLLSSPFGELDHKSLWEALGSDEFADLFTADERLMIARHVPWTRLIAQRRTSGSDGKQIELPEYVRRNRAGLVMKPNRSCGGQGVTIGSITTEADWNHVLNDAIQSPNTWIVQERIPIPRRRTCRVTGDGRFEAEEVFAVYGGYHSTGGAAFVGRASRSPVVNVMQGGGLLAVLGRVQNG